MRDDAFGFTGTLAAGHKEHAIEVPADAAARLGKPAATAPGRRGRPVRATVGGEGFDSAVVDRRGRHWLLVDEAVRRRRGWADGAVLEVVLDAPPAAVDVRVTYATSRRSVPASPRFRRWVAAALAGRRTPAELAIRIVAPEEGRELNRTYRGRDYATNVLSFPAERPEGLPADVELPYLGDLVICADVVAREAAEQGKAPADHWAHLTVHGVLHLLGWDHLEDADAEAMEARERQILAGLGIADPY